MSSGDVVIVIGGGWPDIGTNPEQLFAADWSPASKRRWGVKDPKRLTFKGVQAMARG